MEDSKWFVSAIMFGRDGLRMYDLEFDLNGDAFDPLMDELQRISKPLDGYRVESTECHHTVDGHKHKLKGLFTYKEEVD